MSKKNQIFTQTPVRKPRRNMFDLSHEVKMSAKFGYLYPMMLKECLPGDSWRNETSAFLRMAPMLSPVMHRIDVTTHFFFVPNRLLWDNWEEFITGGKDGSFEAVPPYVTPAALAADTGADIMAIGSLWDYFGLPTFEDSETVTTTTRISALPFYAYAKIFNDYYVDPNLGSEIDFDTSLDGNVSAEFLDVQQWRLRKRGWEKDYFTANLPFAQRGSEVLMPIDAVAESGDIDYSVTATLTQNPNTGAASINAFDQLTDNAGTAVGIRNIDEIRVSNSEVSINDLRRSIALQRWLEVNARSGHRYNEQIFGHFGVRVPDYRLQRAEYLGGGKQPVVISEVLATAESEDVPVGDLMGHGVSVGKSNRFTYRCQEHGFIIGIISVMPRTSYASQGVERLWSRQDKLDYAWPEFANIGEQETLNKEVFLRPLAGSDTDNMGTFGYLPRYSEYKFSNDRIAGDFRSTLEFWHEARTFTTAPSLDVNFTTMSEDGVDSDEVTYRRIFAVQDGTDYLWMQLFHKLTAKRPLPYFGVPSI